MCVQEIGNLCVDIVVNGYEDYSQGVQFVVFLSIGIGLRCKASPTLMHHLNRHPHPLSVPSHLLGK